MKIVVTGHTSGLGKYIFDHFRDNFNNEVIGLSRSTGYDLNQSLDEIIKIADGCDVFVNNAHADSAQRELVTRLNNRVKKMIVSGSQGGFFNNLIPTEYGNYKKDLAELCHLVSLDKNSHTKILHLDLSYLEGNDVDPLDPSNIACDHEITFREICDVIDLWLDNPAFNDVRFNFKITDMLYDQIRQKMGTKKQLDTLLNKINSIQDKSS